MKKKSKKKKKQILNKKLRSTFYFQAVLEKYEAIPDVITLIEKKKKTTREKNERKMEEGEI